MLGQGWVEFVCTDDTVTQEEDKNSFIIKKKHGLLTLQLRLLWKILHDEWVLALTVGIYYVVMQ